MKSQGLIADFAICSCVFKPPGLLESPQVPQQVPARLLLVLTLRMQGRTWMGEGREAGDGVNPVLHLGGSPGLCSWTSAQSLSSGSGPLWQPPPGTCMSLPCSPPSCLASTLTVSSVPKLLPALVQGPGPNPSRAGVKCLGGAAASIPMPAPGPCHVLDPSPVPRVVWSHQAVPCAVGGFGSELLRAVFPLRAGPGMLRQRDASGGVEAPFCTPGILPPRSCRVCQKHFTHLCLSFPIIKKRHKCFPSWEGLSNFGIAVFWFHQGAPSKGIKSLFFFFSEVRHRLKPPGSSLNICKIQLFEANPSHFCLRFPTCMSTVQPKPEMSPLPCREQQQVPYNPVTTSQIIPCTWGRFWSLHIPPSPAAPETAPYPMYG